MSGIVAPHIEHRSHSAAPSLARAAPEERARDGTVEALAVYLKVLASDSRLSLLSSLRTHKTLDEILLAPSEARSDERPDRAVSRQAVQRHLDMLLEAGLVKRQLARRGVSRAGYEYILDHTRVFAIVEEMRALTAFQSTMSADLVSTEAAPVAGETRWKAGPKLLVTHGARVGHVFQLGEAPEAGAWTLGRGEDCDASLVHDPYASLANSEIIATPSGYRLRDLPSAKNGTILNWQRLPRGGDAPLRHGDVVGVGRSLLVFRAD